MYYTNDYSMNPNDYSIQVSSPLAKEADALFHEMGVDMSEAVNSFLRQTILRHGFPFTVEDPTLFTKGEMMEKLRRSDADIEAGRVVHMSMEQLEAMARDV